MLTGKYYLVLTKALTKVLTEKNFLACWLLYHWLEYWLRIVEWKALPWVLTIAVTGVLAGNSILSSLHSAGITPVSTQTYNVCYFKQFITIGLFPVKFKLNYNQKSPSTLRIKLVALLIDWINDSIVEDRFLIESETINPGV